MLVEDAADVVAVCAPFAVSVGDAAQLSFPVRPQPAGEAEGDAYALVAGLLLRVPVAVDELVRLSGMDVAVVMTVLLELELEGRLARHAGGRLALA